ncbi:MULE transposase domain, partial [Dillenia turbinata]
WVSYTTYCKSAGTGKGNLTWAVAIFGEGFVQENDALITDKRENDTACKALKEADQCFVYDFTVDVYDFTVDENDKVENIVGTYGDSIHAFNMFGDVVYFDTSYHSITYGMIYGVWLGIDNYGRTIFFGCVLLQDEMPCSFAWALQTFVRFIKGICTQTIFTDLDPGLREAIRSELPNTRHVIRIWNILPKVSSWVSIFLGSQSLNSDQHLMHCFILKVLMCLNFDGIRWSLNLDLIPIDTLHYSFLCVHLGLPLPQEATSLLECPLLLFRSCRCISEGNLQCTNILYFLIFPQCWYGLVGIYASYQNQVHEEMQYIPIKTCIPIEEHGRSMLTPFAFGAFQQELVLSLQYEISEMVMVPTLCTISKRWMKSFLSYGYQKRNKFIVLTCSPCTYCENYLQLPERYFPIQWRQESSLVPYNGQTTQNGTDEWFHEFHSLTETLLRIHR